MATRGITGFSDVIQNNRDKLHDDKDLLLLFVFWYLDSKSFVLLMDDQVVGSVSDSESRKPTGFCRLVESYKIRSNLVSD
jgi:hypothetical protein